MTTYWLEKDCSTIECSIAQQDTLEAADELLAQGVRGLTVTARSSFAPYHFVNRVTPEFWVINARTGKTFTRYTLEGATKLADELQNVANVMDIRQSFIVRHNGAPVYMTQWAINTEVY